MPSLRCGAVVVSMCTFVAFAALHALEGVAIEPQVVNAAFINACAANNTVATTAMKDAGRVWSEAGVTIRWVSASELPYRSPLSDWLVVRCISGTLPVHGKTTPHLPIAFIRFIGSQPTNTIFASVANANALMDKDRLEARELGVRFRSVREMWLGRILGRAIAHEIGHFLTQSAGHTPSGLMRAIHSVSALTGESLVPFKIARADLTETANRTEPMLAR